ncbi:MAG TPA: murein biosynthesis integral membrane protein MurJ [Actinomycetota bacterium]|nr:murein biosynthesis integral membrane protein MurJ [Actinomycetota bacterium]
MDIQNLAARNEGLARGALVITLATTASRITGFLRVVVVAGTLGTTFLANVYQTANTAPNLLFELMAAGVLTSVFVPTFVSLLIQRDRESSWDVANALTSVALVALVGLALVLALAAPLVMRLLTLGVQDPQLRADEVQLGTTLLRLFAPQVIFYGAGMIMTSALHAHRKFLLPALAPIANNVVVIGVYLGYAALRGPQSPEVGNVTAGEALLLGAGTTAGVIAMTLVLLPQLRRLQWRWRWTWRPRAPEVARGLRVGIWGLGYAGGYQAGLIVVLLLANKLEGGVAAYQWAYTFFYLPHALIGVALFNVLFTAMSEHAARGELGAVGGRLAEGLGMLFFLLLPTAALLVVAAEAIARTTLEYGVMTSGNAVLIGRVLAAFAVGLPGFSAFLVLTRAFYAMGEGRVPALVNAATVALASGLGAYLFFRVSPGWEVAGLAAGHSLAFTLGAAVLARGLPRRGVALGRRGLMTVGARSLVCTAAAAAVGLLVAGASDTPTRLQAALELFAIATVMAAVYVGAMAAIRSPELGRLRRLVTSGSIRAAR